MIPGMQIPESIRPAVDAVLTWLTGYGQPLLFGAGVVGALLALGLVLRFLRTGQVHERLGLVAVSLATLFAMEGMYEVAHGPLGLNTPGSLMFCATFEVVMLHQGSLAAHKLAAAIDGDTPDISRHMRFVWIVAVASGVIASTASSSLTEVVLRLVTPPLAAGIWYMSLYADVEPAERQPSRWIWTPQRIGVRLGLLKPGAVDDLTEVFAQRRIVALVDAGMELHVQQQALRLRGDQPAEPARWWQRRRRDPLAAALRRLQQLTKEADADTVAAAREQLRRVLNIETELFRDDTQPTDRERELMDELRLIMRQATDRLSAEGRRAFDADHREPLVELGGIRMPAHIAAQIGPPPAQVPAQSTAAREPVAEPVSEPTSPARREPDTGSPVSPATAHAPAQRRVTERLTQPAQTDSAKRLSQARARLTRRLKREPTNAELAEATGLSLATVKRWKPRTK